MYCQRYIDSESSRMSRVRRANGLTLQFVKLAVDVLCNAESLSLVWQMSGNRNEYEYNNVILRILILIRILAENPTEKT